MTGGNPVRGEAVALKRLRGTDVLQYVTKNAFIQVVVVSLPHRRPLGFFRHLYPP